MNKPENPRELWAFIGAHFGLWLPHKVFTPGHSTPFHFVADGFFHPGKDLAAWANRRGIKTLAASILAALEYRFSDRPVKGRVLAGSEDQAKTLYHYWQQWCWTLLQDRLRGEPGQLVTRLDNGDFEILAASAKRVRGPGIQRLFWDEVDEIDPEIMSASVGTLTTLNNVQARVVATSTWHHAHGPMGKLVASATEKGFSLHKWNIWESIQNCPPDRHQNGRGCRQCLLQSPCLAKAKQLNARTQVGIASEGCGLFAIDDAIKQYRQWSTEQWEAEAECNRPTLTGLVYSQFDRRVHVRSDLDFCDELPVFRAIDWGLNDFVCLWIQQGKRGEVYVVDELCFRDTTTHQAARQIRQLDASVRVEATYCDPAGRNRNDQTGYSDIDVFRQHGIHCQYALSPWAREIRNGVSAIRAALRPAGGVPRLFVAGKCAQVINAFESYKLRQMNGEYVDEPIKPQPADHAMDALRYYFVNRHALFRAEARRMGYSG